MPNFDASGVFLSDYHKRDRGDGGQMPAMQDVVHHVLAEAESHQRPAYFMAEEYRTPGSAGQLENTDRGWRLKPLHDFSADAFRRLIGGRGGGSAISWDRPDDDLRDYVSLNERAWGVYLAGKTEAEAQARERADAFQREQDERRTEDNTRHRFHEWLAVRTKALKGRRGKFIIQVGFEGKPRQPVDVTGLVINGVFGVDNIATRPAPPISPEELAHRERQGLVGVTRSYRRAESAFVVTHVPTGLAVGPVLHSQTAAKELVAILLAAMTAERWASISPSMQGLSSEERKRVGSALSYANAKGPLDMSIWTGQTETNPLKGRRVKVVEDGGRWYVRDARKGSGLLKAYPSRADAEQIVRSMGWEIVDPWEGKESTSHALWVLRGRPANANPHASEHRFGAVCIGCKSAASREAREMGYRGMSGAQIAVEMGADISDHVCSARGTGKPCACACRAGRSGNPSSRCSRCGKWFMSKPQLEHHRKNADRLCKATASIADLMADNAKMESQIRGRRGHNPMPGGARCPHCGGEFSPGVSGIGSCSGCGSRVKIVRNPTYDWDIVARRYLARLGDAEYDQFLKRKKKRKSDRFSPSEYHRALIDHLNKDDEEGFKAEKMLRGYNSVLGV